MHRQLDPGSGRRVAVLALISASVLSYVGNARAQSVAEAHVLSEAITFRLNALGNQTTDRIVLDTKTVLNRAATRGVVEPTTATDVARVIGGTLGNLAEVMTCSEAAYGPHVTLRDCSLPGGTVVVLLERPDIQGDTAVVTIVTYTDEIAVQITSQTLQLVRDFKGWRVNKVLAEAAT